jgi:peptide deformylase
VVLPIYTYGSRVLREPTRPIEADSPEIQQLVDDLFETMYRAEGLGLAAPQVGRSERIFVMDLSRVARELAEEGEDVHELAHRPLALVNPEIVEHENDPLVEFEEGCLSIPDLRETVVRPDRIRLRYLDRSFQPHDEWVHGMVARVVQHEVDHLDGVLFIDRISAFRRRLLKRRLREIQLGRVEADYPLAPPGA